MSWLSVPEDRTRLRRIAVAGAVALVVALLIYLPFGSSKPPVDPELAEVTDQARRKDLEGLKRSAKSPAERVAATAVHSYARLAGASGADVMTREFFVDSRPAVRAQAVAAWSYAGGSNVQPIIRLASTDPAPQVRRAAVQAISAMQAWDGLNAVLDRMADDDDLAVRQAAMATFEQVAHVRIDATYDPSKPQTHRRMAIAPLRAFVNRPLARSMYADWVRKNASKDESGGAGSPTRKD
jgi:HEAT repeat protein